jgi:hypothetical protein
MNRAGGTRPNSGCCQPAAPQPRPALRYEDSPGAGTHRYSSPRSTAFRRQFSSMSRSVALKFMSCEKYFWPPLLRLRSVQVSAVN